jgi:hypothetical protein
LAVLPAESTVKQLLEEAILLFVNSSFGVFRKRISLKFEGQMIDINDDAIPEDAIGKNTKDNPIRICLSLPRTSLESLELVYMQALKNASLRNQDGSQYLDIEFSRKDCSLPSKIYIRQSYITLVNFLLRDRFTTAKRNWIVSGNPGIGKSYFLLFLLWLLMNPSQIEQFLFSVEEYKELLNPEASLDENPDSQRKQEYGKMNIELVIMELLILGK